MKSRGGHQAPQESQGADAGSSVSIARDSSSGGEVREIVVRWSRNGLRNNEDVPPPPPQVGGPGLGGRPLIEMHAIPGRSPRHCKTDHYEVLAGKSPA